MKKLMNDAIRVVNFLLCFAVLTFGIVACGKDKTPSETSFLKGTWVYPNGAEAYYDGTSVNAQGTKVPTNNVGFNFVVGENYWENVQTTSSTTWSLNHILRTSGGTKSYVSTTFTKVDNNTIQASITGYGTETLVKRP